MCVGVCAREWEWGSGGGVVLDFRLEFNCAQLHSWRHHSPVGTTLLQDKSVLSSLIWEILLCAPITFNKLQLTFD